MVYGTRALCPGLYEEVQCGRRQRKALGDLVVAAAYLVDGHGGRIVMDCSPGLIWFWWKKGTRCLR